MADADILQSTDAEEASSHNSALKHVVFENILDSYPIDQPLSCCFVVDSLFLPSPQDMIGLYKVGWRSFKDCVSFVTVELPLNEGSGSVTFANLPKDDEEFYQFCYITKSFQIRGASSPFQFVTDDFEIIDDMPDGLLFETDVPWKVVTDGKAEEPKPIQDQSVNEFILNEEVETKSHIVDKLALTTIDESNAAAAAVKNDLENKDETKDNLTAVTNSEETWIVYQTEDENKRITETFYPKATWFHNPYSNYIPAHISDFKKVTTVCSEIWPPAEVICGENQTV